MDVVKKDTQRVGVIEDNARDRVRWKLRWRPLKGASEIRYFHKLFFIY